MAIPTSKRRKEISKRYGKCPIECPMYFDTEIATLSDFFAVFQFLIEPGKKFWFRGHPNLKLSEIRKHLGLLSSTEPARQQVARFYKDWFHVLAGVPAAGRSLALFQDLSAAYALGRFLPDFKT